MSKDAKVKMYKVTVMGPVAVGKSSLTYRFVHNVCPDVYDPTIEDAFRTTTEVDGTPCMLEILDTSGQEQFKYVASQWVRDRDGFLLVYSVIDHTSLDKVPNFYQLITTEYESSTTGKTPPVLLLGNKLDLEERRAVTAAEGQELGKRWEKDSVSTMWAEVSAKTGAGVADAFNGLVRMIRRAQAGPGGAGNNGGAGGGGDGSKKKGCVLI